LAALAEHHQVLCVTHLPQIAAFADTHYTVDRVAGSARARRVEGQARLSELTRMLSGIESTDSGMSHAEELVDYADRHRT
jgi:DNA repair protein RecN (Recombination protein N)